MDHLQVLPPGNDPAAETAKTNAALTSKWASMSFPQKATAFLFLPMVLSVLVLFTDIVPTANHAAPTGKAPTPPGSSALTTPSATLSDTGPDSTALAASDAVPDPDPEVEPPAPSASEVADSDAPAPASAEPDEPAEEVEDVPKGEKSKQRQAVDALASGSYAEAARLYEELAKKYPQNKAYAAAAAITRAKVEVEK
jgi:TolA-binding protein